MIKIKQNNWKKYELIGLLLVCVILILNALFFKDSMIAVISAFFGIMYTSLAGKGNPVCYIFGVLGSGLYGWLSFSNALWGNLLLYILYYIPMQILGFFKWNNNLKEGEHEIIKTKLEKKEKIIFSVVTILSSIIAIVVLLCLNDKNPVIDGITTIFSISGMYLTVKRCIEQWQLWIIVNGLSALMWIDIAIQGEKVYSTVLMWVVYFILAVYFYTEWKKEVK